YRAHLVARADDDRLPRRGRGRHRGGHVPPHLQDGDARQVTADRSMTSVDGQRLLRGVFWARLGVAALLLPLGILLPTEMTPGINHGVLALALLTVATSSGGLLFGPPLARPRRIAWLIALLDVALVTGVVAATGGPRSIFTFLYVMLVTASCVTLSRTGGLTIAAAASVLYTGLVFGRTVFPLTSLFEAPQETTALEIVTMFANAGTFLVVAIVAGGLAERFQIQSRTLRDLRAIKDLVFESVGTGLIALDRSHTITTRRSAACRRTSRTRSATRSPRSRAPSRSSRAAGRPARCASGSRRSSSRNPVASTTSCATSSSTRGRRRWCGRASISSSRSTRCWCCSSTARRPARRRSPANSPRASSGWRTRNNSVRPCGT